MTTTRRAEPGPRRARAALALVVVLLHLLLVGLLTRVRPHDRGPRGEAPSVQVRLLPRALPAPRTPAHADAPRAAAGARPDANASTRPSHPPAAAPAPAAITASTVVPDAATAEQPPPQAAAPPASSPPTTSLLDGDAVRRAARDAVRRPGHATLAADQIGRPAPTAQERLAQGVQSGAKGDCLKGEYLGGGMGLLSLPFLAAAALREQCRR